MTSAKKTAIPESIKQEVAYENYFDMTGDGFAIFCPIIDSAGQLSDFEYLYVNKNFELQTGLKAAEVTGRRAKQITAELEPQWLEMCNNYLKNKKRLQIETYCSITKRWFDLFVFSVTEEKIGVAIRDITARKKAEEVLGQRDLELEQLRLKLEAKAAEVKDYATRMEELVEERTARVKRQASLIDLTPDAIMVRDFDGTISFWSAGAEKLYGWTAKDAVGQVSNDLLKTIFSMPLLDINAQIEKAGSWTGELRHKTKDGREVVVESRWLAEKNEAGRIMGILESNVDITERKKVEATVQSERQRLYDVLETMPALVVLITPDYHITFANRSFRDRFGESKGRPCYEYCFGKQEPCKFCESLVPFKTGKPHSWEATSPDGSIIEAHDYPFTDIDGKKLVLEMDIDITARKKAEAQAIESARKLKDAERLAAIGATAGMVGHDIRNPLQAITADVYLAKSELDSLPDSGEKKAILESLEETERNIDYINKIVADLQDYARPLAPAAKEISIEKVFESLLVKNTIPKGIEVTCKIDAQAKTLVADPDILKRIFANLVSNAAQAMPGGGKLTLNACREGEELVLTVEDTGVGIPEEAKDKLFTPLFTTKAKGQGLGLAVVKRLTEALGGTVTFESQMGKGTKFMVRLPPPKKK